MSERWTQERIDRDLASLDECVRNILGHWSEASDADRENGAEWYPLAHLLCKRVDGELGAAVAAALSPRFDWDLEVGELERLAGDVDAGIDPDCGALHANVVKANDILGGYDPDEVLGGHKVRSFWTLLRCPWDTETVCVDTWSIRVALDQHVSDVDTKPIFGSRAVYEHFQLAYRKAAAELGVLPSVVQAVTWIVRRSNYPRGNREY